MAPHAPDAAGWRRMPPDEQRCCLMRGVGYDPARNLGGFGRAGFCFRARFDFDIRCDYIDTYENQPKRARAKKPSKTGARFSSMPEPSPEERGLVEVIANRAGRSRFA
jgi:hypothetical protein